MFDDEKGEKDYASSRFSLHSPHIFLITYFVRQIMRVVAHMNQYYENQQLKKLNINKQFDFTLVSYVERQEQTDKDRKSIAVARKNLGKTIREKLDLMLSNGSFVDTKRAKCEMNTIPLRIARSYEVSLSISHTFTYIK